MKEGEQKIIKIKDTNRKRDDQTKEFRRVGIFAWRHWIEHISKKGVSGIMEYYPETGFWELEIRGPPLK